MCLGEILMFHAYLAIIPGLTTPTPSCTRRGSAVESPASAAAWPGNSPAAQRAPWPSARRAALRRPPSAKSSVRARGRSNLVTRRLQALP